MHFQIKFETNDEWLISVEERTNDSSRPIIIIVRPSIDHRLQVSTLTVISQRHPPVIITTKQHEVITCIHRGTGHHRIGGGRDEQNAGADAGRIASAGHAAADHAIPHREQHCYAGARGSTGAHAPLHGKLVMVISHSLDRAILSDLCVYIATSRDHFIKLDRQWIKNEHDIGFGRYTFFVFSFNCSRVLSYLTPHPLSVLFSS